jgi:hypothetical protein
MFFEIVRGKHGEGSFAFSITEGIRGGSVLRGITVRVRKFKDYLGRTDIKVHSWFRCDNRLLENEAFEDFSDAEILVWIYILGLCSQKKTDTVHINFDRADRFARRKKKDILSALAKLKGKQLDQLDERDPDAIRTEGEQNLCATGRDERDGTSIVPGGPEPLPLVAQQWNELIKSLPKIRDWSPEREKKFRKLECDRWTEVCLKVEASDFLSGRNGKWSNCGVDWVLNKANFTKIIEGNYDNKASAAQCAGSLRGA